MVDLNNLAYHFYLKFCRKNNYGIMSFEWFKRNKNNNPKFYKKAVIIQRNNKINDIIKKI